jgi:uncharacterized protein with PIN domain
MMKTTKTTVRQKVNQMSRLPSIDDAKQAASNAVDRSLSSMLFILDEPMKCKQCGATTEAARAYDPQTAAFHAEYNGKAPSWYCEKCDQHYRRVE